VVPIFRFDIQVVNTTRMHSCIPIWHAGTETEIGTEIGIKIETETGTKTKTEIGTETGMKTGTETHVHAQTKQNKPHSSR